MEDNKKQLSTSDSNYSDGKQIIYSLSPSKPKESREDFHRVY